MNEEMKNSVRETLDRELSDLQVSPVRREALFRNAKGETTVKKKIKWVPVLAVILCMTVAGVALAELGAFDELMALWHDSFDRMNTTAAVDVIDEPDVPEYLDAFEEEYGGVKEDLIISTVPGEGEIGLEAALEIARNEIFDTFATPPEELDAMGVYPEFFRTPYMDEPSEWEFYFTARKNTDINEDAVYTAPGEYRVFINGETGEVTFINWYNDDFWPDYAKRTWDAGKKEYVYEQAKRPDFMKMSVEDRDAFKALFTAEGFDTSALERSDEDQLTSMETYFSFMPPETSLLNTDDPLIDLAVKEIESRFGFTKEDLINCGYVAGYSIYPAAETGICFCYNYEAAGIAQAGECESVGIDYAKRFGMFLVSIDPETNSVTGAIRAASRFVNEKTEDPSLLLGHRNWTADDLPEYYAMRAELRELDEKYRTCQITYEEMRNERDRVMLRHGGDVTIYTADYHSDGPEPLTLAQWLYLNNLSEEQIRKTGSEYILLRSGCSEEQLANVSWIIGTCYDSDEEPDVNKMHPTLLVILEDGNSCTQWYMHFDMELNVTEYTETKDATANG